MADSVGPFNAVDIAGTCSLYQRGTVLATPGEYDTLMWVRKNAREQGPEILGVAPAALEGRARLDLLKEAIRTLLASGQADRVGVWVEIADHGAAESGQRSSFHGIVADKDGEATPAEWSRLTPQPPLPAELLANLLTVEQDVDDLADSAMIGALIEMRRALWVPLRVHAQLRGVLLAGSRNKQTHLPRALLESVAAELALAMELEDERRLARQRHHGIRRVLAALASSESPSDILAGIVRDCTVNGDHEGEPAAVFAAIGRLVGSAKTSKSPAHPLAKSMRFAWRSGSAAWTGMLESEDLSIVWRRALESHGVAGSEHEIASHSGEVARVVAWPLTAAGETLGALVAGVCRSAASLGALEQLELSAALAGPALLQLEHSEEAAQVELRHQEVLAAVEKQSNRGEQGDTQHGITEVLNVIEWLEDGVVLFGPGQEIRALNSSFGQMIGLPPEELARIQTIDDLVAAFATRTADASVLEQSWRGLDLTQNALREELRLFRPIPRVLERAARPIFDKQGAFIGRVEIYRDLTAQRVFQSKLLQTEKLAALGQMVTGIAHELSNPLTSILGYAQRLLVRRDPIVHSHEVRQIFQEAERAGAILRQLLLSARDSRPERRRVALNQVVSRALELQRFSSAAHNIRVQLDLDPLLPFVLGDAGQLQQVLMNLIGNARQAIEEQGRGGTIRVKTERIAEKRVLLEVSDDGPGIPQAIQARIFDPFFTTKPPGVGTGLGLAIVLGIVREHGGKLHLTSNVGQGTVFSIELPATTAVEMSAAGGARPARHRLESLPARESFEAPYAGAALGAWAGARVLVLEDEPTVAQLIGDVLEDEGLRVDVLLDARDALDRAAHENYALAICDMKMPELDGEQFYQALVRAQNPLRERFLFVTGDVLAAHTRNFLERHHLPHVAKPFRVEELTEKIRSVLEATAPRLVSSVHVAKKNAARQ
jgi:signal transduction histidine kinase/ActR/RegA family two-component response regulator